MNGTSIPNQGLNTGRKLFTILVLIVGLTASSSSAQRPSRTSPLTFHSSDPSLQASFDWAKQQALAYSRPGNGTMGPWYEAALPGRNAFCIRDVSHQSEGAAALGLNDANANMFRLFAASISGSRDWAGYWEISGNGHPSPADYVSDANFWYNLPANFDLLDATLRLWRWTGDNRYRDDEIFRRLAETTMHQFLKRWQLTPDTLLERPRIANRRTTNGKFVNDRGIPSYTEETNDFIFGTDQLAAQISAARALAEVATASHDPHTAAQLDALRKQWQALLERVGWSSVAHHYLRTVHSDLTATGPGDVMVLYFGAAGTPEHRSAALDAIATPEYWAHTNIEEETYIPLTLFRYGRSAAAYNVLADLSRPSKPRREYPENSFAVLESITSGVMGVQQPYPGQPFDVFSRSQLPHDQTATLTGLSVRGHLLEITHSGTTSSRLRNLNGPSLRWRAAFPTNASRLSVNGHVQPAHQGVSDEGTRVTWVDVIVPESGSAEVSAQ